MKMVSHLESTQNRLPHCTFPRVLLPAEYRRFFLLSNVIRWKLLNFFSHNHIRRYLSDFLLYFFPFQKYISLSVFVEESAFVIFFWWTGIENFMNNKWCSCWNVYSRQWRNDVWENWMIHSVILPWSLNNEYRSMNPLLKKQFWIYILIKK